MPVRKLNFVLQTASDFTSNELKLEVLNSSFCNKPILYSLLFLFVGDKKKKTKSFTLLALPQDT